MKLMPWSLALGLVLCGCMVGPDYQAPPLPEAGSTFRYEAGWQTVPAGAWQAPQTWWQGFADPELSRLVAEAMQANASLAQAEARYRQAEATLAGSRSELWPDLSGTVGVTRSGTHGQGAGNDYRAGLGVSWVPDLWGRVRRQVEASGAALQASGADLAASRLAIQVAVAEGYVRLRSFELQKALLEQSREAYVRSLALTRNQYEAGIVSRSDVIQAETQLENLSSQLYDLQLQRIQQENALAVLLGLPPSRFALAETARLPALPALTGTVPAVLLARRPDVVQAERGVAQANAAIGVAQAAWLPSLTLSASGALSAASWATFTDAPLRTWSLGPSLAQTLFDGGGRRAERARALARYDEQVAGYRQVVLEALAEIEDALAAQTVLQEQAAQQQRLLALAEQNAQVMNNRYRAGMVSFLEVVSALNTELDARRSVLAVQRDQLLSAVRLAAVLGGGWQAQDQVVLVQPRVSDSLED